MYVRALSEEALNALTIDELTSLMQGILTYQHTMTYTGSIEPEELFEILRRSHRPTRTLIPPPPYEPRRIPSPKESELMTIHQDLTQAHVIIEIPAGVIHPRDHPMVALFNEYFSTGMDSVIFQRIREALGAVYSISATYSVGPRLEDASSLMISFSCQAEKVPDVINAVRALLEETPQSQDLFHESKRTLVSKFRYRQRFFRYIPATVRAWESFGFDGDPIEDILNKTQQYQVDDLKMFYQRNISDRQAHISVVGDWSKIDFESISNVGTVNKLTLEDIFAQ